MNVLNNILNELWKNEVPDAILCIRTRPEVVIFGSASFLKDRHDQSQVPGRQVDIVRRLSDRQPVNHLYDRY